ncbi:MAG: hypothetical protein V4524_04080 [Patescibacteria group bacterium]
MKPTIPSHVTFTNLMLIIVGTAIMALGLYRTFPLKFNRTFMILNGPLAIMLIIGLIIVYREHDSSLFGKWSARTAMAAGGFLPLMILLCMVMAIGVIISQVHQTGIQTFLARHPVIGPFVAALITPTSNSLVPIVETAWKSPELQPMCLYYLIASVQMSVPLFALRSFGFSEGSPIPMKMYAMGFIVSIFMLVLMKPIFWTTEALCQYSGTAWNSVQATVKSFL